MADVHSPETRSYNMSRIHAKDTKPEVRLRKALFAKGFRYRKNDSRLPGKPDIVLPKYKTVIFVNGCFWHAHEGCKYFVMPKTRVDFWSNKIKGNIERDRKQYSDLKSLGWNILVVWECSLRKNSFDSSLSNIIYSICNTKEKI